MALTKSGELLKSTRLKKGLTFEAIERETKIRTKFLRALEEGDLSLFHSTAYARGFLKNYAQFLGLDEKIILALFRRETKLPEPKVLPQGMARNDSSWLRITPTRAVIFIALIVLSAVGYFLFQEYKGFLGAPTVSIEAPKEQEVVKEGELEVRGSTDIDASVFINGEPAMVNETGQFTKTIQVFKGEIIVTVVAKNRRGKETSVIRKIKVE